MTQQLTGEPKAPGSHSAQAQKELSKTSSSPWWPGLAMAAVWGLLIAGLTAWEQSSSQGWIVPSFDLIAHWFYEIPLISAVRRPSQIQLWQGHLTLFACGSFIALLISPWLGRHGRAWALVFAIGYLVRACLWIIASNYPLVPGDSSHYLEVASSILRGEGPVRHYVMSFFLDYPEIREGRGSLDDWGMPLYSFLLAGAYAITGVDPGESLLSTVCVAKATSFTFNLLTLPLIYVLASRWFNNRIGLLAMGLLAVFPAHAFYAAAVLRESLVVFLSLASIGLAVEALRANSIRSRLFWSILCGLTGGFAILSRKTAMAMMGAVGLAGLWPPRFKSIFAVAIITILSLLVIAPWGWMTYQRFGTPLFAITDYFQFTPSWSIHFYQAFPNGPPQASEYYTAENAGEIFRTRVKALLTVLATAPMILSVPLTFSVLAQLGRDRSRISPRGQTATAILSISWLAFLAATLLRIADVTQVQQLGRYYLPVLVGLLAIAAAGLAPFLDRLQAWGRSAVLATIVALLWSDPTWAYDLKWLSAKDHHLHWPAIVEAGQWIQDHPEQVPPDARIMTWFPWELRLTSQRTTILMPRNYSERRIREVIAQYGATHFLWGSFDSYPPRIDRIDPEQVGPALTQLRKSLGLTDARELYRSPDGPMEVDGLPPLPRTFPVRLYRIPDSLRGQGLR